MNRSQRLCALQIAALLAVLALPRSVGALPADGYEIVTLGLTDAEHTREDGYQLSSGSLVEASHFVTGHSERYAGAASTGQSAWLYDIASGTTMRLGYTDAEHTRYDGYRASSATLLSSSGHVAGSSAQFGQGSDVGQTAWLYDVYLGTTAQLGYTDGIYQRYDGYRYSGIGHLTNSGYAAGWSKQVTGIGSGSIYAWLYDISSGAATQVGYTDESHQRYDGYQSSGVGLLTESGYAAGWSESFTSTSYYGGISTWIYDIRSGATTQVGYTGTEHTRSDGYRSSRVIQLTESGYATGSSTRFSGTSDRGTSAWIYDNSSGTTTQLGYTDASHTLSNGYRYSAVEHITESGYAAGYSTAYSGSSYHGISAWLYDAGSATTTQLGLTDAEHTRSDGARFSAVDFLTNSGYVAGTSQRHNVPGFGKPYWVGRSSWLYDARSGTTTTLGYTDAEHTRNDGDRSSRVSHLTDSGFAAGASERYDGVNPHGTSTWLYDATSGTTTRLGLTGARHTSNTGVRNSQVELLASSGHAAGWSARYSGEFEAGQSAWIHAADSAAQQSIVLSERADGYAWSQVSFLSEDGLALGSYSLFDAEGTDLGIRAFVCTPDAGAQDLGSLIAGGLSAAGWSHLAAAIQTNGLGQILGSGRLAAGGDLAYLLRPVPVPEPGTALCVAIGLAGLAASRGRRTSLGHDRKGCRVSASPAATAMIGSRRSAG